MPLLVRPNSILPVGYEATKPDYDYADGVTLYLSDFEDGMKAEVQIPDVHGTTVMHAVAVRKGNQIKVEYTGGKEVRVEYLGKDDLQIIV